MVAVPLVPGDPTRYAADATRLMDSEQRNRLIFLKATANDQRRARERLLETLNPRLSEWLRSAPCVYTPEAHTIIARFHPVAPDHLGCDAQPLPDKYRYDEVAWPDRACQIVRQIQDFDSDTRCHLIVAPPHAIRQGTAEHLVPQYPLFTVDFAGVFKAIPEIWPIAEHSLAVVGCELECGMIIDHYCGYLENDFNPTEIVYEVARWPTLAA